jgi:hypothetical protein
MGHIESDAEKFCVSAKNEAAVTVLDGADCGGQLINQPRADSVGDSVGQP